MSFWPGYHRGNNIAQLGLGNSQESLPNFLHISVAQVLIVYAWSSRPTSQETQEMKCKIFALPQTGPSQTVLHNATVLLPLHTLN